MGARGTLGSALLLVGILIALGPFISGWRVGGEMLDEMPDLDGVAHDDERVGWSALLDGDSVLARRTFIGVGDRAVVAALRAEGFSPAGMAAFSKECCGSHDAAFADVWSPGADRVVVELSAADSDWHRTWPLFSGFGLVVALVGLGVAVDYRPRTTAPKSRDTR